MNTYLVRIPIAGCLCVEVQAESEEQAIELGMKEELSPQNIEELNKYKQICEGNVCMVDITDAEAELLD
jgi:hypothetical protein